MLVKLSACNRNDLSASFLASGIKLRRFLLAESNQSEFSKKVKRGSCRAFLLATGRYNLHKLLEMFSIKNFTTENTEDTEEIRENCANSVIFSVISVFSVVDFCEGTTLLNARVNL